MRTLSLSWSGARQGLITSGLNHVLHTGAKWLSKPMFDANQFNCPDCPIPNNSYKNLGYLSEDGYTYIYNESSNSWIKGEKHNGRYVANSGGLE